MKHITKIVIVILCGTLAFFPSCKKTPPKKTGCTSTLHGFTAPVSSMYVTSLYTCNHGTINYSTGSIATTGSFMSTLNFTNKTAFNTSDLCYYVFGNSYGTGARPLYKVDLSGVTTTLAPPVDTFTYSALTYNSVTNKLYCTKSGTLAELLLSPSSFSATSVAIPVHPLSSNSYGNFTVDNTTGDIYFATGGSPYYIEKYHPGATTTTVVATGSAALAISELRFNKNDNMLYAMKFNTDTITHDFIRIDPATGSITSLSALGSLVNVDFFSATLDPCSNRYILSTIPAMNTFILYQLDMTGTIVQKDTTTTFYQGLDVAY